MNLLDSIALKQNQYDQAQHVDDTEKQKRDALLMAFLKLNPQMLQQLGSRGQEYMQQLITQQGAK